MFIKTSSIAARDFFEISTQPLAEEGFFSIIETIKNKRIDYLISYNCDVYVEDLSGLASILVSEDTSSKPQAFVLQNLIKIRQGLCFNFIANSYEPTIRLYIPLKAQLDIYLLAQPLNANTIANNHLIDEIFTVFYLSKNADYEAEENDHYYYELTYMESGSMEATIDDEVYSLLEHDLILVGPFQKHAYKANSKITMLSIMFSMDIVTDKILTAKAFHCDNTMKDVLHQIYNYSDIQGQFHCEMLINYLKSLITLMKYYEEQRLETTPRLMPKQIFEDENFNEIINYIQNNIYTSISITEICNKFGMSRSGLQNLFKTYLNTTPKQYINDEKMEISRRLLLQRYKTVSEIAIMLDYSSVHYFSRAFKKHYNLNPTEYINQNRHEVP